MDLWIIRENSINVYKYNTKIKVRKCIKTVFPIINIEISIYVSATNTKVFGLTL